MSHVPSAEDLDKLARRIAALTQASGALVPAMAEFAVKNPSFRRLEAVLRIYLHETQECLGSFYCAIGGRTEDLRHRKPETPRPTDERRSSKGRRDEDRGAPSRRAGAEAHAERRTRRRRRTER